MESLYGHSHSDHLMSFALVEGTTIVYVYPAAGNDVMKGVDLKQVPAHWPAVLVAMNSADGVLVGPVDLIEGGKGLIFRMPLRVDGKHWGLFNTIIDMDSYLEEITGCRQLSPVDFAIRTSEVLSLGDEQVSNQPMVRYADVAVPGGV
jgi:sensor domain CHASE-containing protein